RRWSGPTDVVAGWSRPRSRPSDLGRGGRWTSWHLDRWDAELVLLDRLQGLGAELVVHVDRRHRHVLRHALRRLGEIAHEILAGIGHRLAVLADRRAEVLRLLHVERARRRPELVRDGHLH